MKLIATVFLLIWVSFECALCKKEEGAHGLQSGAVPMSECVYHQTLSDYDRAASYKEEEKCDNTLPKGWYRFTGQAGVRMADACVPKYRCGTYVPGWLDGGHPTAGQGRVKRKVCFHGPSGCCQWSNDILVRNCGPYYVYYLTPTPTCNLRYCGDHGLVIPECNSDVYKTLTEHDRSVSYTGVVKCDNTLAHNWYRITGAAGSQIPTFIPERKHCGTDAPGWMSGDQPTVADGAVDRQVCYHGPDDSCQYNNFILARNCTGFYIYLLPKPPRCNLRYCGCC